MPQDGNRGSYRNDDDGDRKELRHGARPQLVVSLTVLNSKVETAEHAIPPPILQ
jgi:hypothetical protein